ncbi:MAG: hypothetical protein ACXQTJ_05805 [Candidatus Syntropharchaeales archaeon]
MKWLDKLTGRKKVPSTVCFDEIDSWLDAVSKSLFRDLLTNADRSYNAIKGIHEDLIESTSNLQHAEPNADLPAQIRKRGLPNRDKMVKQLQSFTEKIVIPDQTDYKTILSFCSTIASSIDSVFGKSSKNIYYVRSLFPEEVNKVLSDLNRLRTAINQFVTPIRGKETQIMNLERVPEIVEEIKDLKLRIETEEARICRCKEESSGLNERIKAQERRLSAIEEDKEWLQFKELESELISLEAELKMLESEVSKLFAPIGKALNLIKKLDETGRCTLSQKERGVLSSIQASPIQVLDEDISGFLNVIKEIIEGDSTILKGKKREKMLKSIDHLLDAGLSAIRERRNLLQNQIEAKGSELSNLRILDSRREIEASIASDRGELTRLVDEVERSERHLISLKAEIRAKEKDLSEALRGIVDREVVITDFP